MQWFSDNTSSKNRPWTSQDPIPRDPRCSQQTLRKVFHVRDWRVLGTEGALAGGFQASGSSSERASGVGDVGSEGGREGGALSNQ